MTQPMIIVKIRVGGGRNPLNHKKVKRQNICLKSRRFNLDIGVIYLGMKAASSQQSHVRNKRWGGGGLVVDYPALQPP